MVALRDVVPLVRLFAAVGALDFHEERIVRVARLERLDVLEGGLDLETDFDHDVEANLVPITSRSMWMFTFLISPSLEVGLGGSGVAML